MAKQPNKTIAPKQEVSDEVVKLKALFEKEQGRATTLSDQEVQDFWDDPEMKAETDFMLEYEKKLGKYPQGEAEADADEQAKPEDTDTDDTPIKDDGGEEGQMVPDADKIKDVSITGNREAKALWYD